MDSWRRSACYPQGSFYPLSDGPSTRYHRITKPDFRPCSTCWSRSQAPLCLYTLRAISNRAEGTFGRLRYSLGGAQRFPQRGWKSREECKGIRELDCETNKSSRDETVSYTHLRAHETRHDLVC